MDRMWIMILEAIAKPRHSLAGRLVHKPPQRVGVNAPYHVLYLPPEYALRRSGVCAPYDHEKEPALYVLGSPLWFHLPQICCQEALENPRRRLRQSGQPCSLDSAPSGLCFHFEYLPIGAYAITKLLNDTAIGHNARTCRFAHYTTPQNIRQGPPLPFRSQDCYGLLLC